MVQPNDPLLLLRNHFLVIYVGFATRHRVQIPNRDLMFLGITKIKKHIKIYTVDGVRTVK